MLQEGLSEARQRRFLSRFGYLLESSSLPASGQGALGATSGRALWRHRLAVLAEASLGSLLSTFRRPVFAFSLLPGAAEAEQAEQAVLR